MPGGRYLVCFIDLRVTDRRSVTPQIAPTGIRSVAVAVLKMVEMNDMDSGMKSVEMKSECF